MKIYIKNKELIREFIALNKDIEVIEKTYKSIKKTNIIIGHFDAIHKGHFELINKTKGMENIVLYSLFNHKYKNNQMATLSERLEYLNNLGIDDIILDDFVDVENIEAINFIKDKLIKTFNAGNIYCGFDFQFGKDRQGNVNLLKSLENKYNYKVHVLRPFLFNEVIKNNKREFIFSASSDVLLFEKGYRILSSSVIKQMLPNYRIEEINNLLIKPYLLISKVIRGKQLARILGFPTANILNEKQIYPKIGVYGVRVHIEEYDKVFYGVSNIGYNPTVENYNLLNIETHIFDFNDCIYDKILKIELITYIRNEEKFSNVEKLKEQVHKDILFFKKYLEDKKYGI